MKYFTYLAEQSFKTDAEGQRVFYSGGPWSRPYIIPDEETERRLFRKHLWFMRIVMGGLILIMPFLLVTFPIINKDPIIFLIYIVGITVASRIISYLVFRSELSKLSRTPTRIPLKNFYLNTADKHSLVKLILGLACCLLFVVGGLFLDGDPYISGFCIVLFGIFSLAWAYMLYLKLTVLRRDHHQ